MDNINRGLLTLAVLAFSLVMLAGLPATREIISLPGESWIRACNSVVFFSIGLALMRRGVHDKA